MDIISFVLHLLRVSTYLILTSGAAEACGGGGGQPELHDPPLIFDLSRDQEERSPLDPESEEYQAALQNVQREREALLWDIATDNVSTANYATERAAAPCCNRLLPACRCQPLSWRAKQAGLSKRIRKQADMLWHLSHKQCLCQTMKCSMLIRIGVFIGEVTNRCIYRWSTLAEEFQTPDWALREEVVSFFYSLFTVKSYRAPYG